MLARTPPPITVREFWDLAIARGLFPICCRGKKPIGEGWSVWPVPIWQPGCDSIGLRCRDGGLSAFDADKNDVVTALALLAAFREVLGPGIPVRWGRYPRFTIPFYLVDEQVKGASYRFLDGDKLQLISGHFVAHGPHEDTGVPYKWENWDAEWPRLTKVQLQNVLARVPAIAGTSLIFHADYETCDQGELTGAAPQTQDEWQIGRDACLHFLGALKQRLMGMPEGRGTEIFSAVGILKFGMLHNMCTREEIEDAITEAGHDLSEGRGGRRLGEEITRQELLPVLRGNPVMSAILNRRTLLTAFQAAHNTDTPYRTGLELSLDNEEDDLPWVLYQRLLRGEVHLFTGQSGAGKSALVSDAMWHYLCDRSWLDAEVEEANGHILWIAAEDSYGTERRLRYLLRQEPNGRELANRFHVVRGVTSAATLESHCIAQSHAMAAGGKRLDAIVLDTFGASGLCFADNDTELVTKAMHTLKSIASRTNTALIVTDHLPLGNPDAWQKGNGAKSGMSGFVYRVTVNDENDLVSIDCGKSRGTPKVKSYTGRIISKDYGLDKKGRMSTVNIFERETQARTQQPEITAVMKLASMLPGAESSGMEGLRNGAIVTFASVAAELGSHITGTETPGYALNKDAASKIFPKDTLNALLRSGHFRSVRSMPYYAIYAPATVMKIGGFPW